MKSCASFFTKKRAEIFLLRSFAWFAIVSFKVLKREFGRDVVVVALEEAENIPTLVAVVYILADALACVVKGYARLVDVTVALRYIVDFGIAHS